MIELTKAPIRGSAEVCICLNLLARRRLVVVRAEKRVAAVGGLVMMGNIVRALVCLTLWSSGELVTRGRRRHMRVERMGCVRVSVRGLVDACAGVELSQGMVQCAHIVEYDSVCAAHRVVVVRDAGG